MAALRALLEVPGGRVHRLCRIGTFGFDCQHRWKSSSVAAVPLSKAEVPPQWDPLDLSFSDARAAYKSKSTWELIRAYIVLKLSSSDYIVSHHQQLMQLGQRVLGRRLFRLVMRYTFYGHFVGGESADAIQPLVKRLRSFGVKSILDYSAEEDLSEQEAKQVEMAGCISQASSKEELPAGYRVADGTSR